MQKAKKRWNKICVLCVLVLLCTACGKSEEQQQTTEQTAAVSNGPVETSAAFEPLGLVIDVLVSDEITNVSYEITDQDIAVVYFKYNGLECEFRGSADYLDFELAGVENNGNGDILVTSVQGCNATYYKLNPGRVVFWSSGHIHYSLYVYVTADDAVLDQILTLLTFEDHYEKRTDVEQRKETSAKEFAEQIVSAVQEGDLQTLAELVNYPLEFGNGQTAANKEELLAMSEEDVFTDALTSAVDEASLENLRAGRDDGSYLIGSTTKNIYFRLINETKYKIIKINN